MSQVTDYVEERQNEIEDEGRMRRNMRRVTVRLPGGDFAMLAEVAAALKDTNTGCAEELLSAAIAEAWYALEPRTVEDVQRVLRQANPAGGGENKRSRQKSPDGQKPPDK